MLFVGLLKAKAGSMKERISRRIQWKYPEGLKLIAEYWLQASDPNCITITECDTVAPLIAALSEWDDVFDYTIIPAITAEEGIQLAKQMM